MLLVMYHTLAKQRDISIYIRYVFLIFKQVYSICLNCLAPISCLGGIEMY